MSNEKVANVNEITIRFEQMEHGNRVNWRIIPDDQLRKTMDLELMDLAEHGAPLSLLGARALFKLCGDGLVFNALETANATQTGVAKRLGFEQVEQAAEVSAEVH